MDTRRQPTSPIGSNAKVVNAKPAVKILPVTEPDTPEVTGSISPASSEEMSGWTVQVSSATTETLAWDSWKKIQGSHKILAGQKANVVKAELGAKGTFYRVRLGHFADQSTAKSACMKLKSGGVSCFVSKSGA